MDITETLKANSDQINASDLIGAPATLTIKSVTVNKSDQPVSISGEGEDRPYKPCLTSRRVLAKAWGVDSS